MRRVNRCCRTAFAASGLWVGVWLALAGVGSGQPPAGAGAVPEGESATAQAAPDAGAAAAPSDPAAAALQEQIDQARRELLPLGERLGRLGNELGALAALLRERTGGAEPPAAAEEIRFRPPLLRQTTTEPIFCLCRNDRVYIVGASGALLRAIRRAGDDDGPPPVRLTGADVELQPEPAAESWRAVLVGPGESAEEAAAADSRWREFLGAAKFDPEDFNVQFDVYGDSFAAFRAARQVAWELGFATGWLPRAADTEVIYSQTGGGGGTTVQ